MPFRDFFRPMSVEQAIMLHQTENGVYMAGGTDVLVDCRTKRHFDGKSVIDLTALPGLSDITEAENRVSIGALCTHAQIAASELVHSCAPNLAKACGVVGSPQIRHRGTIGGNLGNASPAADSFGPLALYGAEIFLRGRDGARTIPVEEFITGPYRNGLRDGEIITGVQLEKLEGFRHAFYKLGRREALAISRLTVSVAGKLAADGTIADLRISYGSAFPHPFLITEGREIAAGRRPDRALLREAARAAAAKLPEIAGIRASTLYKQPVSEKLTERLLCRIFEVESDG